MTQTTMKSMTEWMILVAQLMTVNWRSWIGGVRDEIPLKYCEASWLPIVIVQVLLQRLDEYEVLQDRAHSLERPILGQDPAAQYGGGGEQICIHVDESNGSILDEVACVWTLR